MSWYSRVRWFDQKKPTEMTCSQMKHFVIFSIYYQATTPTPSGPTHPRHPILQYADKFSYLLNIFFCTIDLPSANVLPYESPKAGKRTLSICLTKKEIRELTLRAHYAAQARTLSEMGVCYTLRPDGSPVVLHSSLKEMASAPKQQPNQPDFRSLSQ